MSPIAPAYYQEYDFIGETPRVELTAPQYENNAGMMLEVIVTATKVELQRTSSGDISEVVVTATRPTEQEMRYYGMMSEVVVNAERYPETDIVYTRPNLNIDYSQSSVKYFYLYVMIIIGAVTLLAIIKTFTPLFSRPVYAVINRKFSNHIRRLR